MQEIQGYIIGDVRISEKNGEKLVAFDMQYDEGCYIGKDGRTSYIMYKCAMWTDEKTASFLIHGRKVNVTGTLFIQGDADTPRDMLLLNLWVKRIEWYFDSTVNDKRFWSSGAAESEDNGYPF